MIIEEKKLSLSKEKEEALVGANNEGKKEYSIEKEGKGKIIKKISSMAFPSVLSSLIVFTLETINLIFAGKVKTNSPVKQTDIINAIGVGNIFMNFGGVLFGLGLTTSLETLCSQSYGRNNLKELSKWVKMCKYFMTGYFIILCGLSYFSTHLILLLGQPEDIAVIASHYICSLVPSFILQFLLAIYTKTLNSQQIYTPILYINIICLLLHPVWCYVFYYLLELDIKALGIAYDLTSLLMLLAIFIYTKVKKLEVDVSFAEITWNDWKIFIKTTFSCGILSSIDTLGFEIVSFISSYLPQNQLDANICVINIYNNIYAISLGFATALTTLVGNYMGESKPKSAMRYAKMGVLINFVLAVVISLLCILFHRYIALIYIDDRSILKISSNLIRLVGLFIICDALQLQLSGIMRGIGKQFVGMMISVGLFIFLQTGLCLLFFFVFNLGVYGLWYCQMIVVFIACIIYFLVLKYSDWKKLAEEASKSDTNIQAEYEDIQEKAKDYSDKNKAIVENDGISSKFVYSNSTAPD